MTKAELLAYLKKLELPQDIYRLLEELVNGSKEVNQELLNTVADVLDLQAQFHEAVADLLSQETEEYEALKH